ncbi:MAG: anhydro-N-acetylmuramic acid kinase [Saprospiraceae bacterium]|nr:anhydro-N-acetylmuramic acid kinase [Saprospiraceae bacterium]
MKVIGLMSGTSLDGLDMALVEFKETEKLNFKIQASHHIAYDENWSRKLANAFYQNDDELKALDRIYGEWLGIQVRDFLAQNGLHADLIGSHGHTVFHRPNEGLTLQIGSGKQVAEITGIPVVCNFRQQDVALGGQGAPLVPIGDATLFSDYAFCLNLGGFSNASWDHAGERRACDIGPCNMLLNGLSQRLGLKYDPEGQHSRNGKLIPELLEECNQIAFYKESPPKSLGREWFLNNFKNVLSNQNHTTEDLLRTAVEHAAVQIDQFLKSIVKSPGMDQNKSASVFCTGGGTYHNFLMDRLKCLGLETFDYIIPAKELVDNKEALVFALLAFLKWKGRINVLKTVTGASRDHSSGEVWGRD